MYAVTFQCKLPHNANRGTRTHKFRGSMSHLTIRNFADANCYRVVNVERVE